MVRQPRSNPHRIRAHQLRTDRYAGRRPGSRVDVPRWMDARKQRFGRPWEDRPSRPAVLEAFARKAKVPWQIGHGKARLHGPRCPAGGAVCSRRQDDGKLVGAGGVAGRPHLELGRPFRPRCETGAARDDRTASEPSVACVERPHQRGPVLPGEVTEPRESPLRGRQRHEVGRDDPGLGIALPDAVQACLHQHQRVVAGLGPGLPRTTPTAAVGPFRARWCGRRP